MKKLFKRVFWVRQVYHRIAYLLSPLLRLFEKRWKTTERKSTEPVFIVGVPRSGSTYTYQLITSTFSVKYIDNVIDVFHNNIRFAFKLSDKIFKGKQHKVFKSDFGNTMSYSWRGPSECGDYWYRFFPRTEYYISEQNIEKVDLKRFKEELNWLCQTYEAPTVFKNLLVSGRIYALQKICPEATFLYIKRDPFYNAQSIINARRKIGVADKDWWSAKPYNYDELKSLPLMEKVAKQVFYLQEQIEKDLKNYYPDQYKIIYYEDYKNGLKESLKAFSKVLNLKCPEVNLSFDKKDQVNLSESEAKQLKEEIEKLPWNDE